MLVPEQEKRLGNRHSIVAHGKMRPKLIYGVRCVSSGKW
jgi:hypothetical protein